jgi:mRNA interferase RelE/StbE
MDAYKINFKLSVEKDLRSIPKTELRKILERIESLAANPRPRGCEKLTGQNKYRVRQGNYRILYTVDDKKNIIRVIHVGHRKDIYRISEEKAAYMAVD